VAVLIAHNHSYNINHNDGITSTLPPSQHPPYRFYGRDLLVLGLLILVLSPVAILQMPTCN
jgi:hypothetical protein